MLHIPLAFSIIVVEIFPKSIPKFNQQLASKLDPIGARKVMFLLLLVGLPVTLSVCPSDYLKSSERICMMLAPEVCFGPRNKPFNFGDDPVYHPDAESRL